AEYMKLIFLTAILLAIVLTSTVAAAQQVKSVAGLVVNFGLMPAEIALRADGHRDMHPQHPPSGSQHLLVTLADEKSQARIGDAAVSIEVTDPRGRVETKALV